ncbi:hypothetical protein BVY03_01585 [bacterium K02(2017)]|nr:hypothetical protein BVY03_01585 [bacterium K02(2017)]
MSKLLNVVFFFFLMLLMGGTGFMALELTQLKDLYHTHVLREQKLRLDKHQLLKSIAQLKVELEDQQQAIAGLSGNILKVTYQVENQKPVVLDHLMVAPEFAVNDQVFIQKANGNSVLKVTGDKTLLNKWAERNELFFEHVIKKTMPLVFDKRTGSVVVENIVARSVFHQMGLRKGDKILRVNGRRMTRGVELRSELLKQRNTQILVLRDRKRIRIDVDYKLALLDKPKTLNEIILKLSKENFNQEVLDQLMSVESVALTQESNSNGVKIGELNDNNILSKMNFKPYDVITKVSGQTVDKAKIVSAFTSNHGPLEIDYLRKNQTHKVLVKFLETQQN